CIPLASATSGAIWHGDRGRPRGFRSATRSTDRTSLHPYRRGPGCSAIRAASSREPCESSGARRRQPRTSAPPARRAGSPRGEPLLTRRLPLEWLTIASSTSLVLGAFVARNTQLAFAATAGVLGLVALAAPA